MDRENEAGLRKLLQESESLIEKLGPIQELYDKGETILDDSIRREAHKRFRSSGSYNEFLQIDGYVEITVADDEMSAYADFFPPSEGMEPVRLDDITRQLEEAGVVFGIDWKQVEDSIQACNLDHLEITNVRIAIGETPQNEIPEHFVPAEILKDAGRASRPDPDDQARIDFKTLSPFTLVSRDDELARVLPTQPGRKGCTVLGRELPYGRTRIENLEPGDNTVVSGDRVTAACDGTVEVKNGRIRVNQVMTIETDVDYRTGHISFPGDIIIKGQIKDGFKVQSGGSIYCANTMDASEIEVEEDLIVKRGLIGRRAGIVKAGGTIRVKFIENCFVEGGRGIMVDAGILNSQVYTHGRIELGVKGIVVGGRLYAQKGLVTTQIGTESGPKAEIYCGVDYSVENKLEWIRDQSVLIAGKLNEVRRTRKKTTSPPSGLSALEQKLQEALHRMNDAAGNLLFQLDKNDDATVTVRGQVYPGTYIEICHVSYIVRHSTHAVTFRLLKDEGRIISERISESRQN